MRALKGQVCRGKGSELMLYTVAYWATGAVGTGVNVTYDRDSRPFESILCQSNVCNDHFFLSTYTVVT
jgi:hypothetical protein